MGRGLPKARDTGRSCRVLKGRSGGCRGDGDRTRVLGPGAASQQSRDLEDQKEGLRV